jgi:hypothetical protein
MGEKRQFNFRPCGASIDVNRWKGGFSVKCPTRRSTTNVYPAHTWEEIEEFINEFCSHCGRANVAG